MALVFQEIDGDCAARVVHDGHELCDCHATFRVKFALPGNGLGNGGKVVQSPIEVNRHPGLEMAAALGENGRAVALRERAGLAPRDDFVSPFTLRASGVPRKLQTQ